MGAVLQTVGCWLNAAGPPVQQRLENALQEDLPVLSAGFNWELAPLLQGGETPDHTMSLPIVGDIPEEFKTGGPR